MLFSMQYLSNSLVVLSSSLTFTSLLFGLFILGLPVLGLIFTTSLIEFHNLIIFIGTHNVNTFLKIFPAFRLLFDNHSKKRYNPCINRFWWLLEYWSSYIACQGGNYSFSFSKTFSIPFLTTSVLVTLCFSQYWLSLSFVFSSILALTSIVFGDNALGLPVRGDIFTPHFLWHN
nr:MAG TPA: hypothetical protein [Caudoviricetes sp.]